MREIDSKCNLAGVARKPGHQVRQITASTAHQSLDSQPDPRRFSTNTSNICKPKGSNRGHPNSFIHSSSLCCWKLNSPRPGLLHGSSCRTSQRHRSAKLLEGRAPNGLEAWPQTCSALAFSQCRLATVFTCQHIET